MRARKHFGLRARIALGGWMKTRHSVPVAASVVSISANFSYQNVSELSIYRAKNKENKESVDFCHKKFGFAFLFIIFAAVSLRARTAMKRSAIQPKRRYIQSI
jgi:hypothetical protein